MRNALCNTVLMVIKLFFLFCIFIVLSLGTYSYENTTAIKNVQVVVYYDYPPFYIKKNGSGLGKELADYLTSKSNGKYSFNHVYLPKGRLDKMLQNPKWIGIVVWLNPKFVNDQSMTKYIWSQPIMHEIDYVASSRENPIDYKDQTSLYGHTIGTVLNHRYADIEDALKAGKIKQVNSSGQEAVVGMLLKKRIDVAFISKSTIKWFEKEFLDFNQKIYLAKKHRNEFDRYILITRTLDKNIADFILKSAENLKNDKDWHKRASKYSNGLSEESR